MTSAVYRLPVRTMAKQAAEGHGLELRKAPQPRQTHLTDPAKQQERLLLVAKAGDEAKAKGLRMARYVLMRLHTAGFHGITKESTVYRLRPEARAAGLTNDTKGAK
jgi:hypothetical protein